MISIEFLYFFIPVFMGIYAVVSPRIRTGVIAAASFAIAAWINPFMLVPLSVSAISAYAGGRIIGRANSSAADSSVRSKKAIVTLMIVAVINAAEFFIFSRSNYDGAGLYEKIFTTDILKNTVTIASAVFPLTAISYCADIYRRKFFCEKNFITVAAYVSFFPVMAAGPLVRYDEVSESLKKPVITSDLMASGIRLMLIGFAKKLVLANTMFELWTNVHEVSVTELPLLSAWIGIAAFGMSVYFELSAFSDCAGGVAMMMGIKIPKNFDQPFSAVSLTDFMHRFNITLCSWVNDHIYQPVVKISSGKAAMLIGVTVSSTAAMMWYAVSPKTAVFGIAAALIVILEQIFDKQLEKLPKALRRFFVILLIAVLLPVTAMSDLSESGGYIAAMFGANHIAADMLSEYIIKTYFLFFAAGIFFMSGLPRYIVSKINSLSQYVLTIIQPVIVIALLLLCTAFLISGDRNLSAFLF